MHMYIYVYIHIYAFIYIYINIYGKDVKGLGQFSFQGRAEADGEAAAAR